MIQADHIGARVAGRWLLADISLRLAPGTLTVVLGRNGAGKSTLLRLLSGALAPTVGDVRFGDDIPHLLPKTALARRRAVLSQHHMPAFGLTVGDIVTLGRLPHRGTSAARHDRAALTTVCGGFALQQFWERRYPTLSGGERQRTHLARAAAQLWRPDEDHTSQALFLDEPAAALDLAQQRGALDFARTMARRGAVVLAVLHDPNHAVDADQVVMLRDGHMQVAGAPEAVLTAANLTSCLGVAVEAIARPDGRQVFVA